jgi:site-specific DNA-methyltransferase (adenine-specific)
MNRIIYGDCFAGMATIPNNSIDIIVSDLPYGTTRNKWDSIIDLELMWIHFYRIAKINAPFILHCQEPFTTTLINSNKKKKILNIN